VNRSEPRATPRQLCKILGYGRKSTRKQREATLEQQTGDIVGYTKHQGLRYPIMFQDSGVSGRLEDRPGMNELLEEVEPGTIVICRESTRFARDVFVFLKIYREILKRGGTVEFVNVGQADSIYLTIMGAIADYDFQKTVLQMRNGRVATLRAGGLIRREVWGYDKLEDASFRVNEDKAKLVRKAFSMRKSGATLKAIAEAFIDEGAEGGSWSSGRISALLYNAIYAGFIITKIPRYEFEDKRYSETGGSASAMLQRMYGDDGDDEDDDDDDDSQDIRSFLDAADEVFDDFVIYEDPALRIVEPADFRAVNEKRLPPDVHKAPDTTNKRHPLLEKCQCPHCADGHYRLVGDAFRCSNALHNGPCPAPTLDRNGLERAMFLGLYQLADDRKDAFGYLATKTYEEVISAELGYRNNLLQEIAGLEKSIEDNAEVAWKNPHLRKKMEELADKASDSLDSKRAELVRLDKEPAPPDPRTSLLELRNMLDQVRGDPNIPYDASEDTLALRDALGELVLAVTFTPKESGLYDVHFILNGSQAVARKGRAPTQVTVVGQQLTWSANQLERKLSKFASEWASGIYSLTDEEWASRPKFRESEPLLGKHMRHVFDMIAHFGEIGIRFGENTLELVGSPARYADIRTFRASREAILVQAWFNAIRPRQHAWVCFRAEGSRSATLREFMEAVHHPFLDLAGCQPGAPDTVLTNAQWAELSSRLSNPHPYSRRRINSLFAIVRDDGPMYWTGDFNLAAWFNKARNNGDLLKIVEFFHAQQGKALVYPVPDLPTRKNGKVSKKRASGESPTGRGAHNRRRSFKMIK
jgi:DNA invertase Pin-like site-specific DNA recombinase